MEFCHGMVKLAIHFMQNEFCRHFRYSLCKPKYTYSQNLNVFLNPSYYSDKLNGSYEDTFCEKVICLRSNIPVCDFMSECHALGLFPAYIR